MSSSPEGNATTSNAMNQDDTPQIVGREDECLGQEDVVSLLADVVVTLELIVNI